MKFVTSWAQGVIVAVIIATIIEMLLPNNGNSKYIRVVIGMFILFSVISPVIGKVKDNNDYIKIDTFTNNKTAKNTVSTSTASIDSKATIKKMYEENLKIDIKSKLTQKGYAINDINLEILDNDEYTLNKIEFKVTEKINANNKNQNVTTIVENIENIKVSLGGSSKDNKKEQQSVISESEKRKLKEYLSNVYEVNENNIIII